MEDPKWNEGGWNLTFSRELFPSSKSSIHPICYVPAIRLFHFAFIPVEFGIWATHEFTTALAVRLAILGRLASVQRDGNHFLSTSLLLHVTLWPINNNSKGKDDQFMGWATYNSEQGRKKESYNIQLRGSLINQWNGVMKGLNYVLNQTRQVPVTKWAEWGLGKMEDTPHASRRKQTLHEGTGLKFIRTVSIYLYTFPSEPHTICSVCVSSGHCCCWTQGSLMLRFMHAPQCAIWIPFLHTKNWQIFTNLNL